MISEVKGNGSIILFTSGRVFDVGYQSYQTALWLPGSEILILDDARLLNVDQPEELIAATRIK